MNMRVQVLDHDFLEIQFIKNFSLFYIKAYISDKR